MVGPPADAATTQIIPSGDGLPSQPVNYSPLLAELDALIDRMAAALGRLRQVRATLAGQLEVGDARIDLAALQRLAEETNRLRACLESLYLRMIPVVYRKEACPCRASPIRLI